jgi:cardiolipin synthase
LREMLIRKAKEGVDVRVIAPNEHNDSGAVYHASHDTYDELLEGGVKIYEYQPTFIHTKALVVDGAWSLVGSANMDNRSRKINQEVIVGIADSSFGAKMEEIFATDLSRTKQIELSEWRKRGLWPRFRELMERHLVEQY